MYKRQLLFRGVRDHRLGRCPNTLSSIQEVSICPAFQGSGVTTVSAGGGGQGDQSSEIFTEIPKTLNVLLAWNSKSQLPV